MVKVGSGRDAAAGSRRLGRSRSRGRHARRHLGLGQERAGTHRRRRGDRRRRLLVRQGLLADPDAQGHQQRTISYSTEGSTTHTIVLAPAWTRSRTVPLNLHRQPAGDPHRRHDRPGRYRLGRAAVRAQGGRSRAIRVIAKGNRCAAAAQPDHPGDRGHGRGTRETQGHPSPATFDAYRETHRLHVFGQPAGVQRLRRLLRKCRGRRRPGGCATNSS